VIAMANNDRKDTTARADRAASPDALVQADPDAAFELTDEQLSKVAGGRVKTSDKQQKAVMDFIKG
jgi:hypothetical protein